MKIDTAIYGFILVAACVVAAAMWLARGMYVAGWLSAMTACVVLAVLSYDYTGGGL